jgi:hypothetical protein
MAAESVPTPPVTVHDEKMDYVQEEDINEKVDLEVQNGIDALLSSIDKKKERATVWKIDLCVAPLVFILQFVSNIDKGNIGFAATQGLTTDLGLKGSDLNVNSPNPPSDCRVLTGFCLGRCVDFLRPVYYR